MSINLSNVGVLLDELGTFTTGWWLSFPLFEEFEMGEQERFHCFVLGLNNFGSWNVEGWNTSQMFFDMPAKHFFEPPL